MSRAWMIGIDVGGTYLRAARVGEGGEVAGFIRRPSRAAEGTEGPIEAIAGAVEELAAGTDENLGVGIGAPGVIDPTSGRQIGETPHLPHWADFPLRERAADRTGRRIVVDNDANCAALAEHRLGAARGTVVSMTVTVGTGVGCGIVVGGKVLRGAWGGAGEIGHLPLGEGDLECRCGVERCVEPEMSGSGLGRRAIALQIPPREATEVFAAAEQGDAEAVALTARFCDRLGAAIATAVNLLNPEVVVIGGGLSRADRVLLPGLNAALARYALASHRRRLRLVTAELGERAGVVGAGLAAWETLGGTP